MNMTNQNLSPIEIQSYSERELNSEYESTKDILNLRYEALRKEVIESIAPQGTQGAKGESNISPTTASQELFILMQRGMIGWMEEWTKFHPATLNTLNMLNKNEKIKEIALDATEPKSATDTDIYTLALYRAANLPLNLQGQLENLLTHMVLSTLYPPTQNQNQSQSQSQCFPFA